MNKGEIEELKKPIIEACIKSAKKIGWSDAMGILRGTLFLESEPLSLDTLAERTGYSKTTVRTNMNYLENYGMAVRVVGPVGKQHRYKQHRYVLETDPEALMRVILSAAKEDVHSVLQALNQIEKNIEEHKAEAEHMSAIISKTKQFYEEMNKILDLMNKYPLKELIERLDRNEK
ncbi:MAG: hypothetical protein A4E48_00860 [Methanosaeta sp. PtaU1.Bin060]|nr:MAG: hypothetical protein A4E48_00860 [Methanosaeta sp. PtaU1.Bin060]